MIHWYPEADSPNQHKNRVPSAPDGAGHLEAGDKGTGTQPEAVYRNLIYCVRPVGNSLHHEGNCSVKSLTHFQ